MVVMAAQDPVIEGARGHGRLLNGDKINARFEFNAVRLRGKDGKEKVEGQSHFEIPRDRNVRPVVINFRVGDIKTNGTQARIAGPGVLKTLNNEGKPIEIQGSAVLEVNDKHAPGGPKEPRDLYAIHFEDKNGHKFNYAGAVVDGELTVKPRS